MIRENIMRLSLTADPAKETGSLRHKYRFGMSWERESFLSLPIKSVVLSFVSRLSAIRESDITALIHESKEEILQQSSEWFRKCSTQKFLQTLMELSEFRVF